MPAGYGHIRYTASMRRLREIATNVSVLALIWGSMGLLVYTFARFVYSLPHASALTFGCLSVAALGLLGCSARFLLSRGYLPARDPAKPVDPLSSAWGRVLIGLAVAAGGADASATHALRRNIADRKADDEERES